MFQVGEKVKYKNYKGEWVFAIVKKIIPVDTSSHMVSSYYVRYEVEITGIDGWDKKTWNSAGAATIRHEVMENRLESMANGIERAKRCLNQSSK